MGVTDLITRVDSICKKYEKFDIDKQREANVSGDDAFSRLYSAVESALKNVLQVPSDYISTISLRSFEYLVLCNRKKIVVTCVERYRKYKICCLRRIKRKLSR